MRNLAQILPPGWNAAEIVEQSKPRGNLVEFDLPPANAVPAEVPAVEATVPEVDETVTTEPEPMPTAHSTAADAAVEEAVIAQICKDGGLQAALSSGLGAEHFSDGRLGMLFEEIQHSEDGDDLEALLNLSNRGKIDEVEFSHLADICRRETGTLSLKSHCHELQKRSQRRKAKALEHRAEVHLRDGNPAKALELLQHADEIAGAATLTAFDRLQSRKFDPANLTPEKEPLLSLKDIPVLFAGNVLTLVGPDKSGKSHIEAAIAKAITEPGTRHLGFTSTAGGRIAYLDLEQEKTDFESLLLRANCDSEQVAGYHLTGYNAAQAKAALVAIMEGERDLRACMIDGFADLLNDVNDSEESNNLVAELMAMAEKYDVAILGVLHLNPNSEDKSRGHLGSQLGRKSQTVLQVKPQTDGSRTIFTQRARKRPIPESQGIRFEWSEDAHGFVEIEGTPGEIKQAEKVDDWTRTLYDIQAETEMKAWKYGELCKAIAKAEGVKERTAKSRVGDFLKAGLLTHGATTGNYTSALED